MPFPKPRNRSRRSSQSSNLSRDNSVDRGGTFQRSYRSHSGNRYNNSSRDNSADGRQYRNSTNWRSLPRGEANMDSEIAEMSRQFSEAVELSKPPGVLLLPSSTELVKRVITEQAAMVNGGEHVASKKLFDHRNPSRPIAVSVNQRLQYHANLNTVQQQQQQHHQEQEKDKRKKRNNRCSQSMENTCGQPVWYDQESSEYRRAHNPKLIEQIVRIDHELQKIVRSSELFRVIKRVFL